MIERGVLWFAILVIACLALGRAGSALIGSHDPSPPCTAGTSSIDAAGNTTTVWYPSGCQHR